jgi:hypothetical protein
MKVIKYSEFQMNENSLFIKEDLRFAEGLDAHYYSMLESGYDNNAINEGIWDLLGTLGSGFVGRLKNYAAGWLLQKLGLPSDNVFLSEWAKNVVELIEFRHITNYFGKGSCKYWADAICKGLAKTLAEKGLDMLFGGVLGVDVNFNSGVLGTLAGSLRDGFELKLLDSDFINGFAQKIDGTICGEGTSFTNIFGGGKITPKDVASAAKEKAPAAPTADAPATADAGSDNSGGGANQLWSLLGVK